MTATRLEIGGSAYVLTREDRGAWRELARLDGGPSALLTAAARDTATDADIEVAIERAEEWLMPHARALTGDILEVRDPTGRLVDGLGRGGRFTLEQVESGFNRVVESRSGAQRDPVFVAHLVLVRELAHHGRVAGVNLSTNSSSAGGRLAG